MGKQLCRSPCRTAGRSVGWPVGRSAVCHDCLTRCLLNIDVKMLCRSVCPTTVFAFSFQLSTSYSTVCTVQPQYSHSTSTVHQQYINSKALFPLLDFLYFQPTTCDSRRSYIPTGFPYICVHFWSVRSRTAPFLIHRIVPLTILVLIFPR